ncbi:hypothetical protein [Pengzhenrongella phosphoraccumulans]|uniref:hypothetical protein n=1 Tax=Pengzhenrongella phosphoraccumulans TaxID=3114394 RepID=UPI00388E7AE6
MSNSIGQSRHEMHPPADAAERPRTGTPLPLTSAIVLGCLVVAATTYGLLSDDAYRLVTDLTRSTWRAQDAVTLACVPVLIWAAVRARSGSFPAHVLSVGLFTWFTYCYAHQAVGVPFNAMFLVYVAILALAGFATIDGIVRVDVVSTAPAFTRAPSRAAAWFLAIAGVGIAGLWLSDIVPALPDGLPVNIHLAELPNPTWVFDLAWLIPWALAAAWMLHRRHPAAPVVSGVVLVMLLILSVAMLTVTPMALADGLGDDPTVRPQLVAFTVIFALLGGIEASLLVAARRRIGATPATWLRPGWWPQGQ